MPLNKVGGPDHWRDRKADLALEDALSPQEALREALSIDLADFEERRVPFMDWALRVPEPKAGRLDFESYPFQVELYKEGAADRELVIKKATQLGISAYLIRWTMYWTDVKGLVALYIFPTQSHAWDFADQRLSPAIDGSEYLRSRISPSDVQNKGLKKIGLGFMYMRGSESKRGLDSVDADVLALDEFDTLTQRNIGDAERRISGSRTGLIRRVGVPSIHDFGISKEYDRSDQRRWMVKCSGCRTVQAIRFRENLALKDDLSTPASDAPWTPEQRYFVACEKCRKPLNVLKGEWVASYPDRSVRGYHMPRLIVGHADLSGIVKASKSRKPYEVTVHHNKDLAESYEAAGGRISKDEIHAAQREFGMVDMADPNTSALRTAGVDVASTRALNVRISEHLPDGRKKALWIGEVDKIEALDRLMHDYQINMCVIDAAPEYNLAKAFAARFSGRVYLCRYLPATADKVIDVDEETTTLKVQRVSAIDATFAAIREQRNLLPHTLPPWYEDQMTAVVRRVERDEFDKVTVRYESTDSDDALHAECYDLCAREAWLIRQTVAYAAEEAEVSFEDEYEFERSGLGGSEEDSYSTGPGEGEYGY